MPPIGTISSVLAITMSAAVAIIVLKFLVVAAKDGSPKILDNIVFPTTAIHAVDKIVTELAVIEVTDNGLVLKEIAEGVSLDEVISKTEAPLKVAKDLKTF